MSYSITTSHNGCYPDTTVLINKLGLQDQRELDQAESIAVTLRSAEIESRPNTEPLTFDFYRALHKNLFGDIYDWAGEVRKIDFSKNGTSFYSAEGLVELGIKKFARLDAMNEFKGLDKPSLIDELTDFYHELNMLHPFREGNGRTQRLFFSILLRRLGYDISFAECDTDALMMATIYAAQGVSAFLHDFFEELLS